MRARLALLVSRSGGGRLLFRLWHSEFDLLMPEKQMVNMLYEGEMLKRVDDFRFAHRFKSRTKAIRWLVQAALDNKLAPKAAAKKD